MKLTKTTLKQIIKEELSKALNEELPQLSMKDKDAWIAKQREKRGMKPAAAPAPAATASAPEEDSAPMSTADGRSIDANEAGQSMESYDSMTPDQARRAINAALKAGEIDKDEWRRLRRKYHKRRKPNVKRALDRMEKDPVPTLTPPKKGQKAPAIYKNKAAVKRAVKRGAMAPDEAKLAREWEAADTPAKQAALKKKYGIK